MQASVKLTFQLSGAAEPRPGDAATGGTYLNVLLCFILTHGSSSILSLRHTLIIKIDDDSLR